VLVACVILIAVGWWLAIIPAIAAALILILGAALWLYLCARYFLRQQRRYYQLLHELNTDAKRRQWARESLSTLYTELHRLLGVYRQATLWGKAFGPPIHRPFGVGLARTIEEFGPSTLRGDLPLAVAIGSSESDEAAQRSMVTDLQRSLFDVGWLRRSLERRMIATLGLRGQPSAALNGVWTDPGLNSAGPLSQAAAGMDSGPVNLNARTQSLQQVARWVNQRRGRTDGTEWMLSSMAPLVLLTAGAGLGGNHPTGRDFIGPLLVPSQRIGSEGFTHAGISDGPVVAASLLGKVGLDSNREAAEDADLSTVDTMVVRLDITHPVLPTALKYFVNSETPQSDPPDQPAQPMPQIPG
jgi:hypothetical protein